MAKLTNPRGYLSYTQISEWLRSPKTYTKNYIYGEQRNIDNAYLRQGKLLADFIEHGGDTDELTELVAAMLPRYDQVEYGIEVNFKTPKGDVVLLGKIDTFNSSTLAFREYKTGKVPWTQTRADKHLQLLHYAALVWLKTKKLPPAIHLDWAETEPDGNGEAIFTGNIKSFAVKIDLRMVLEYLNTASRVANEIHMAYQAALSDTLL